MSTNQAYSRHLGRGNPQSYLMQDEPGEGVGFSRKMSLERRFGDAGN
jgi:hypothetical protein